jgi:hypothetical protein
MLAGLLWADDASTTALALLVQKIKILTTKVQILWADEATSPTQPQPPSPTPPPPLSPFLAPEAGTSIR